VIKEKRFQPEEVIMRCKEAPSRNFYFMMDGEASLTLERHENNVSQQKMLTKIQKGNIFGIEPFFSQSALNLNIIADTFVSVSYFTLEDFIKLLSGYPREWEIFHSTKDRFALSNRDSENLSRCSACESRKHSLQRCPLVNFVPNLSRLRDIFQDKQQ